MPQATRRALLADFDSERAERLARELAERGYDVERVADGEQATRLLLGTSYDIAILSGVLPGRSGFDVSRRVKAGGRHPTRVVLILDATDPYTRGLALAAGADRIVDREEGVETILSSLLAPPRRPDVAGLLSRREEGVREGRLALGSDFILKVTEGHFLEALTEERTGLYNKNYLLIRLGEEFKKAHRYGAPLSCALIGVGAYSGLHRSQGAEAAEGLIGQLAGVILGETRDIDVAGRIATDLFLLLLPSTPPEGARRMAERLLDRFRKRGLEEGLRVGLAFCPNDAVETAEALVQAAHEALRRAEAEGSFVSP